MCVCVCGRNHVAFPNAFTLRADKNSWAAPLPMAISLRVYTFLRDYFWLPNGFMRREEELKEVTGGKLEHVTSQEEEEAGKRKRWA